MMRVWAIISFLLSILSGISGYAQNDTLHMSKDAANNQSHYRISLLTCSAGEDIWETFGHACIRVVDSTKQDAERDKIYNYGFYEATEENTLLSQALNGRVIDLLDTITFEELMIEYTIKKRKVEEQVFILNDAQKEKVVAFLKKNLKKENRYYEFDTFYDNCTTRIRDLFVRLFGNSFKPGPALPDGARVTFRDASITSLCPAQYKYWFGFALNLSYSSRADRVMSNNDALFSPYLFSISMATATLDGNKLCEGKTIVTPNSIKWEAVPNMPFIMLLLISVFTISMLLYRRIPLLGKTISYLVLIFTGALGCFMVYLWNLDGEPAFKDNLNILWALPTNILVPFLPARIKRGYSVAAIFLIGVSLVLHILGVQIIPLFEVTSLLLALIWIYAFIYRVK